MFTWSFDPPGRLIACGADAEKQERFRKLTAMVRPWPLIFTEAESAYNSSQLEPERAFCAGFCCKEAVYKALETSFGFIHCQFFYRLGAAEQELVLDADVMERFGITANRVFVFQPGPDEMAAVVYLFGK